MSRTVHVTVLRTYACEELTMTSSRSPAQRCAQHAASPGGLLLLILLLALASLTPPAAAAIPFQQTPVDWTLVPDKPEAAANLSTNCICALLNGTCTPGCCCDTACPTELIQGFRDAGQCLPEGTPPQQLPFCVPAETFAKVRVCLHDMACLNGCSSKPIQPGVGSHGHCSAYL